MLITNNVNCYPYPSSIEKGKAKPGDGYRNMSKCLLSHPPITRTLKLMKAIYLTKSVFCNQPTPSPRQAVLSAAQYQLLQCATPEAVVRLKDTKLRALQEGIWDQYFKQQKHESLLEYLHNEIMEKKPHDSVFVQVTTHSKLLSIDDEKEIAKVLKLPPANVRSLALQNFGTEQEFGRKIRRFFNDVKKNDTLLLVQCDSGDQNGSLIACARYCVMDEFAQARENMGSKIHVVFVVQLPRVSGGCFVGFQGGKWLSVHIDDLRPETYQLPSWGNMMGNSIGTLFTQSVHQCRTHGPQSGIITRQDLAERIEQLQKRELAPHPSDSGIVLESEVNNTDEDSLMDTSESHFSQDIETENQRASTPKKENSVQVDTGEELPTTDVRMEEDVERMEVEDHESDLRGLDYSALIRNCVQGAAAMLKEEHAENVQRTTERIQILLKLLSIRKMKGQDCRTFAEVVGRRVALLLSEKEEKVMRPGRAANWLRNEAASMDMIHKAGTFRRSSWQCIQQKVTPMLAGIVALMDTNSNLNILHAHQDLTHWMHQFWLELLDNENATELKYQRDLRSPKLNAELTEMVVRTIGCGQMFCNQLPFSWVIYQQVEKMLHQVKKLDQVNQLQKTQELFEEWHTGKIVTNYMNKAQNVAKDILDLYLTDFVHMIHKESSDGECQVMVHALRSAAFETRQRFYNEHAVSMLPEKEAERFHQAMKFGFTIPLVHLAYHSVQSRLQHLRQLFHLLPDLAASLLNDIGKSQKNEMNIDVLGLTYCLENLEPHTEPLENQNQRNGWLDKVQRFKPTVERILQSVCQDSYHYGDKSRYQLLQCRYMWNRLLALHLFVEHVCPRGVKREDLTVKRCMPFWIMLSREEKTDFKEVPSMEKVKKFLESCNISASKHFFGELEKCKYCKQPMQNPVKLPCGHIFCHACLQGRRYADINECPERGCRKMFGEVKELKTMSDFGDKIKAHNEYKRSCNTFFMALVSQLCFNEDTPPEPDVVRMLLSCVTKESQLKSGKSGTKDFNLFDVCIDPSPVIRSFLLQLLLRSDMEQVKQYLQEYFDQARKFTQDGSQTLELCMLCIQCMEDSFHNKISQHGSSLTARASMVTAYLKRARLMIGGSIKEIDCIEAIALSRFGLAVTADIMFSAFVESGRKIPVSRELRELFDAAGNLCDQVRWAKIFLVKQICRVHGTEALQTITEVPYLARWILPPEARQKVHDDKDMYLICGQLYEHLRETVTKVVLGKSVDLIQEVLDGSNDGVPLKETSMLLALYREVTTSYIHEDPNRLPSQEVLQNLVQYYHQLSIFQMKTFCQKILSNQIGQGCPELTITRGQDRLHQQMSALVIHAMVIYSVKCTTVRQKGILEPFLKMFQKPQDMNASYFPTMPQDELSEIREAVHSGRTGGQADTLWVCPNGHPYVIGDCGRPAVEAQCQTCGIKIGGMHHNPAQGNVKAREDDQTQPGHILGNASTRNTTSEPMRGISAVQAAILRMITHITMFVAANRDPQGVTSLIQGVNLANGVNTFLWQHIQADIQTLSRTIRKSPEDCVLMMHMIIQNILINETSADRSSGWGNKQSRQTWEAEFARVFITPIVSGLENKLNNANQYMAKDERLGNNPLIKLVYETERVDTGRDVLQVDKLAEEPEVWRFRSRITINNVTQELSEFMTSRRGQKPHQLLILQAFLQKEHSLRMLRYLPSILKLQRLLSQGHQRRVNKNEAMSITIKEMLEKMVEGPEKMEMQTLIKCFKEVWYTVREEIAAKGVKVANGILRVPKEQCRMQIEGSTPLSILLPNSRGHGVCSLALVRHLINLQNDFLEEHYWKYRKNAIPEDVVQPKDLIVSHIISYHPEHDLMPLILASCNYSYKISPTSAGSTRQESELQYDYDALGKQIEEHFLKGKVRLGGQLDTITFREDTTHARVFRDLEEKIPQEPLSHQVKHQIVSELRDFQDISDSLVALDLSAEFLVTVGGEPGSKIAEFMQNTLSLETGLKSAKARQHCSLSHVKSLWLVLAYEQAKHLTKRKQDSFHILDDRYREKLSPEQVVVLAEALKHLNTETFLCELFEFIVLYVCDKREVAMDEDAVEIADDRLGHQLYSYIDSKDGPEIPSLVQEDGFPENFQVKHCDHIWKETLKMMTNPESQF
ncbi:E3 ubiquitin-protein ligase rnf213-alpha-like [Lingula anatina]|uniref:E3 ubiquitin-protein ligase rnf213-alpha-like n=1 Tax=Lingula anatina TaxID=7574 RepID=A0A1S3H2L9_LINAN|nr:E3 ubiquitin-protein ligase rnf213-alpha-like [Lingula anatina]|eukprot:XP_013380375.1 E3 ubiquitin-protein ligase rnf213-alpha-like [Lingula anatina]